MRSGPSGGGVGDSLVTAVPLPLMPGADRQEVGRPLVLHLLGEAQQYPVVDVLYPGPVRRPRGGEPGRQGRQVRRCWKVPAPRCTAGLPSLGWTDGWLIGLLAGRLSGGMADYGSPKTKGFRLLNAF